MWNSQKWKCPQNNSKGVLQLLLWRGRQRVKGWEFFSLTKFLRKDTLPPSRVLRFSHRGSLEKTANNSRRHPWFPPEMTSEKISCSWRVSNQIWLAAANFPRGKNKQKHYPDLGSDASSVWNSQTLFRGETSDSVTKCRLFPQASLRREWR